MMTVLEAVREAMWEEMARDEQVFVMGEDIGARGGVFLATDGFVEEFGEARVIDTPLAESSIAGIALGAAMNGMRPIAEIEFADFIWPTINQLVGEAARARYGSNGQLSVPLVVRAPYGGGVRGGLYHSQSVEAFFAHTPGLEVVTPATPYVASRGGLNGIAGTSGPARRITGASRCPKASSEMMAETSPPMPPALLSSWTISTLPVFSAVPTIDSMSRGLSVRRSTTSTSMPSSASSRAASRQ